MRRLAKGILLSGALVGMMLGAVDAVGAGFQLYTEGSAEALGQGGAISARRDMLSNAWYNPAALAGIEQRQVMVGNTSVNLKIHYDQNGYHAKMEDRWRNVPHLFYAQPIDERLGGTLAVTVPYGLTTEWQSTWQGRGLAIDTSLIAVYVTPALAWRVNEKLSLSVGLSGVMADALIRRALPLGEMELRADGIGLGGMLAAHYQLDEEWAFGAKFQSRVDLALRGNARYSAVFPALINADAETTLRLPATLTVGVSNTSVEKWTFGFDVVWTEWSTYDQLLVDFDRLPFAGVPGQSRERKDWTDVFSFRLGAEYELNEQWVLRGGYIHDQSPMKEETRSPEMPCSDRHMVTVGVGYTRDAWGVDVGYSYLMAKRADVGARGVPPALNAEGEYRTTAHLVGASFRYKF